MNRSSVALLSALMVPGCTSARPLAMPVPRYPDMLRSASIVADVPVQLSIDRAGHIQAIRIDTTVNASPGTPTLFAFAIRQALRGARFESARRFGVPVAARVDLTFRFVLRRPTVPLQSNEQPGVADSLPMDCPSALPPAIIVICASGNATRARVVY